MNKRGFANVLLFVIVLVVVVGAAGLFVFKQRGGLPQQNTQPVTEQTQKTVVNENSGAEGSGLPDKPAGAKFCKNQQNQIQEATYGEKLTISSDKKSILLNGKVAVSLAELPTTISISVGNSFNVTNSEFTSAVLSPTKSLIAFTVAGGTHGWAGVKNVFSGLTSHVSFQFEGAVNNPKWSYDGQYVVFSKRMPKGVSVLALVNVQNRGTLTSEYEKILDFTKINPLPPSITSDIPNYFWSSNKDTKVYLLVTLSEHAELLSVNASDQKWDFVCSAY